MMYFLILGLLALSCSLTLGWGLWRLIRWGLAWAWPQRFKVAAASSKARKTKIAKTKKANNTPPWHLTQQLVLLRDFLPLSVLVALLYGGARLAAHGMIGAAQDVPTGFYQMVSALGWAAVVLLALSAVGQWACWRCRRV